MEQLAFCSVISDADIPVHLNEKITISSKLYAMLCRNEGAILKLGN